jgi:hypothetical protein
MPLNAKQRIFTIHPTAIIHHPDHRRSAALYFYRDVRGACIQAVFHEFADYGGWSFDNLARCDLAGECIRKDPNF